MSHINVVVGIPTFGIITALFQQCRQALFFPLVSSSVDQYVFDKPIAEARNEIVERALELDAKYVLFLDDDVLFPPELFMRLSMHNKDIATAVYWSKSSVPIPLLFRRHLAGAYMDWHVGEFIEVDNTGCGATLIKTDVFKKIAADPAIGKPWFSTDYSSFPHDYRSFPNNTEDVYFYWKAKRAGFKIWADTGLQCGHIEKTTRQIFQMPPGCPQSIPGSNIKPRGDKLIADLGAGESSPYFEEGIPVRFDIREEVHPDVRCDLRHIPEPDLKFDIIFSSHTLEHFSWRDTHKLLREWIRILKIGGELRLVVPNLQACADRLKADELELYDFFMFWGEQSYSKNYHAAGFTPKLMKALLEESGCLSDIKIRTMGGPWKNGVLENVHLQVKATKVKHLGAENIAPTKDIQVEPQLDKVIAEQKSKEALSDKIVNETDGKAETFVRELSKQPEPEPEKVNPEILKMVDRKTKILCLCEGGNVRSVSLAFQLKNRLGFTDVITGGLLKLSSDSLKLLCGHCDVIFLASKEEDKKQIPDEFQDKLIWLNYPIDRWGNPYHPELSTLMERSLLDVLPPEIHHPPVKPEKGPKTKQPRQPKLITCGPQLQSYLLQVQEKKAPARRAEIPSPALGMAATKIINPSKRSKSRVDRSPVRRPSNRRMAERQAK